MANYSDILLTVDYDRTLTAPDSTIPQRNIAAIREFIALGGAFTVNTGRSVPMCKILMSQIPVNAPFLLYNGSAAYDLKEGALSLCQPIRLDMWETLAEVAKHWPQMNLEVQGVDAHYSYGVNPEWDKFYEALGCAHAVLEPDKDYTPFLKFSMFGKLRAYNVADLFTGTEEEFREMDRLEQWLRQRFGDAVDVFRSGHRIVDIHAKGVSKIRSARALQQRMGRKILVCIGDAENDLSMLDGADYAYCPADAVVADRYENVCRCADGAVADVIYEKIPEILGKEP